MHRHVCLFVLANKKKTKCTRTLTVHTSDSSCLLTFCRPQSRLKKIIPANSFESVARKLGAVLQKPKANQEAQALLTEAQKNAERLFNPLHKDGWSSCQRQASNAEIVSTVFAELDTIYLFVTLNVCVLLWWMISESHFPFLVFFTRAHHILFPFCHFLLNSPLYFSKM